MTRAQERLGNQRFVHHVHLRYCESASMPFVLRSTGGLLASICTVKTLSFRSIRRGGATCPPGVVADPMTHTLIASLRHTNTCGGATAEGSTIRDPRLQDFVSSFCETRSIVKVAINGINVVVAYSHRVKGLHIGFRQSPINAAIKRNPTTTADGRL